MEQFEGRVVVEVEEVEDVELVVVVEVVEVVKQQHLASTPSQFGLPLLMLR